MLDMQITPANNRRNAFGDRGSVFKIDENSNLQEGSHLFLANISQLKLTNQMTAIEVYNLRGDLFAVYDL
jgi:hypothetical protein